MDEAPAKLPTAGPATTVACDHNTERAVIGSDPNITAFDFSTQIAPRHALLTDQPPRARRDC